MHNASLKKTMLASVLTVLAFSSTQSFAGDLVVRVGTEPSFAPFEFMDEKTKTLTGFDIDLINAIADASGFKTEISTMPFDGLIPAILTGSLDVGISAFTITDERRKRVAFSAPYIDAGLGIVIRSALKNEIKGVNDLQGRKLCGQIGTSGAMYSEKIKDAQVTQFNSASETYLELRKGGCDAIINDRPVHAYYMATAKPDDVILLDGYISAESYGIVMNKNNTELQELVNRGFDKIKEDGTYQQIYDKWFKNNDEK